MFTTRNQSYITDQSQLVSKCLQWVTITKLRSNGWSRWRLGLNLRRTLQTPGRQRVFSIVLMTTRCGVSVHQYNGWDWSLKHESAGMGGAFYNQGIWLTQHAASWGNRFFSMFCQGASRYGVFILQSAIGFVVTVVLGFFFIRIVNFVQAAMKTLELFVFIYVSC